MKSISVLLLDTFRPCKSSLTIMEQEAGLDLIMCQQAIPQWLFAKNFWITQDDNTIAGTSESNIKPSWIIKESYTLNDKRSQQRTILTT